MKLDFDVDISGIDFPQFNRRVDAAIMMYCNHAASVLQSEAQQRAPWTDRTTLARQRLKGSAKRTKEGYAIDLTHGVDYGKWLELAHDKRYAILKPTIELRSPEVIEGLNTLFKRL